MFYWNFDQHRIVNEDDNTCIPSLEDVVVNADTCGENNIRCDRLMWEVAGFVLEPFDPFTSNNAMTLLASKAGGDRLTVANCMSAALNIRPSNWKAFCPAFEPICAFFL